MIAEIKIQLLENGAIQVTAPFENQVLCLGMVEVAKGVITAQANKPASNIVIPKMEITKP
jgi:hypothetical protein